MMNERINELLKQSRTEYWTQYTPSYDYEKFAELIVKDMHRKVIASILITDVVMEEKGQKPTSEDYIQAINKDFGVEE
jgi:hypothetical protein